MRYRIALIAVGAVLALVLAGLLSGGQQRAVMAAERIADTEYYEEESDAVRNNKLLSCARPKPGPIMVALLLVQGYFLIRVGQAELDFAGQSSRQRGGQDRGGSGTEYGAGWSSK